MSAQFAKPAIAAAIQFSKAFVRTSFDPESEANLLAIKVLEISAMPTEVTTAAEYPRARSAEVYSELAFLFP